MEESIWIEKVLKLQLLCCNFYWIVVKMSGSSLFRGSLLHVLDSGCIWELWILAHQELCFVICQKAFKRLYTYDGVLDWGMLLYSANVYYACHLIVPNEAAKSVYRIMWNFPSLNALWYFYKSPPFKRTVKSSFNIGTIGGLSIWTNLVSLF